MRNGVIAVTEEMKTNLMRTAYNTIIYEALDFTTGLFTPEGETASIGIGLPTFIRGMAETVKAKIRHFGIKNMKPGDIYVTNDAINNHLYLNQGGGNFTECGVERGVAASESGIPRWTRCW